MHERTRNRQGRLITLSSAIATAAALAIATVGCGEDPDASDVANGEPGTPADQAPVAPPGAATPGPGSSSGGGGVGKQSDGKFVYGGFAGSPCAPAAPSAVVDTTIIPSTGAPITVPAGGDLQAAIDQAAPGQEIVLAAGATFTGNFVLPVKSGTGWITIRTSNMGAMPPPGTRVKPELHAAAMAKISTPNVSPAVRTDFGAHHYRFIGIEITTTLSTTDVTQYNLVSLGYDANGASATSVAQLPHDLVFDRTYLHGTPTGNVRRGILMNSGAIAVIDSNVSDFHEIGADSQALGAFNGTGPFKIVNNYLEGAGENFILGGSDPSIPNLVAADLEFRYNYVSKPLAWKADEPTYAGLAWSEKNLFELKSVRRAWVEGNVFEHSWPMAQVGIAILFTVRNQDGSAPWSVVEDVTFIHNEIRQVAGGVNVLASDYLHPSLQTKRIWVGDNVFEDVGWGNGGGRLFQVSAGNEPLECLTLDHNTGFAANAVAAVGDNPTLGDKFTFTNNLAPHAAYGFFGGGVGEGKVALDTYFSTWKFAKNLIPGAPSASYPPDNFFPGSVGDVGFTDLNARNYRLTKSSPYVTAGTDSRAIGADIDALEAAIHGVE